MEKDIRKKAIILLSCYLLALSNFSDLKEEKSDNIKLYYYEEDAKVFACLNGINVIFLDSCEFDRILPDDNNIYIIDSTNDEKCSIAIYNSYKITDKEVQKKLIDIIFDYVNVNNLSWVRSKESVLNEWDVHNICYKFSLFEERTQTVDLDMDEEYLYSSEALSLMLGNNI